MLNQVTITSSKYAVDESTKKYIVRKISRLDKHMPRKSREGAMADVILREVNRAHGNKYEVEVILKLPGKTIVAKDSTVNVLAAMDIVEAKLHTQLRRYKTLLRSRNARGRLSFGFGRNRE